MKKNIIASGEQLRQSNRLHLENIRKVYGQNVVLEDIDLSVNEAELCTVVGPSGHGKSTLLRIILGQELPTSGHVYLSGREAGYANAERGIVYQKYSLFPHLSVLDNILLGKKLQAGVFRWKALKQQATTEALKFLEKIHLEKHAAKYPYELSGGMQQRVAIAQALIMKPKILLMDEPFGALDPGTREDMQLYLLDLWQESHMTIFFITHDLEEAVFLGTRLIVVSQFYSDDRTLSREERGARVVTDLDLKGIKKNIISAAEVKYSQEFRLLIKNIRREGFDPGYRQHVADFNLQHPHAFQTLEDGIMRPE